VLFAVVGRPIPAYLNRARAAGIVTMPQIAARPGVSGSLFAISALVAIALLGTGLLWVHYGTAVFFETIRAGFVACFG